MIHTPALHRFYRQPEATFTPIFGRQKKPQCRLQMSPQGDTIFSNLIEKCRLRIERLCGFAAKATLERHRATLNLCRVGDIGDTPLYRGVLCRPHVSPLDFNYD